MNKFVKGIGRWVKAYWAYRLEMSRYKQVHKFEINYGDLAFWVVITIVLIRHWA